MIVKAGIWVLGICALAIFAGWQIKFAPINLIPGVEISPPLLRKETLDRPYVLVTEIKIISRSETNLVLESILRNTGKIPANNMLILPFFTVDGTRYEFIGVSKEATYLASEPRFLRYTLRFTNENLSSALSKEHEFMIHFEINYDGLQTHRYGLSVSARYNPYDGMFNISTSTIR